MAGGPYRQEVRKNHLRAKGAENVLLVAKNTLCAACHRNHRHRFQKVFNFCKFFVNSLKIKSEILFSISLQKYSFVFISFTYFCTVSRIACGIKYSFKSSWVSLYKLCTPGFGQVIRFFNRLDGKCL